MKDVVYRFYSELEIIGSVIAVSVLTLMTEDSAKYKKQRLTLNSGVWKNINFILNHSTA